MNIHYGLTQYPKQSLALGFFDGLHQGHKVVIKTAVNFAKENNTQSAVIVFKEHPMSYIMKNSVKQLITFEDKISMLEDLEVDNIFVLEFDSYLEHLSAAEYLKDILIKYFSPIAITTGFNHSFGYKRQGNSEFLRNFQSKYNYRYFEIPPITCNNIVSSSSSIRNAVMCGNLELANALLGYEFFLNAVVIPGQKLGRKLDFPTANFVYPSQIVELPTGVYLVTVEYDSAIYRGILNYGCCPTVSDDYELRCEVHILDFNRDIYNEKIKVSFVTKIRNEIKFSNITDLKHQIIKDIDFASNYKNFLSHNNTQNC